MMQGNVSQDDDITVVVEEDNQEPSSKEDETTVVVEETTEKNETKVPDSQPGESGSEAKRSSQIIAKLGEEKKAIVSQLITVAKENPNAQAKLKEMISADTSLSTYIRTKFGSEYDQLIQVSPPEDTTVDVERIKAEQYAKGKADAIFDQLEANKSSTVDEKAQSLGFNSSEVESFRRDVTLLTGAGEDLDTALTKAAILTNVTKATAGMDRGLPPSGGTEQVQPKGKVVKITPGLAGVSRRYGGNQGMAKVVDKIKGLTIPDEDRNWINGGVVQLPDVDEKTA